MKTLQDLYFKELRDLYGSEKLLVRTLPKIMQSADSTDLREALTNHVKETRGHVSRLERIFQIHGEQPSIKYNKALEGILREAEEDIADETHPAWRDAAIVAAVQQIEHYEMAAYATLQTYALHLGHEEAGKLLLATLAEERAEDRKLTGIVHDHLRVNPSRAA